MAMSFMLIFFSMLVVFVIERYYFEIPILASSLILLALVAYVMYSLRDLKRIQQSGKSHTMK